MEIVLALLGRHFWFLALAATVVGAYVFQRRFTALAAAHPERADGYERALTWFTGLSGGLWLLMGVGIVAGGVPSVLSYLDPARGNMYVLLWHAAVVGALLAGAVWVFLRGGARFVVDHPGLLHVAPSRPGQVKLLYTLCLVAGLVVEAALWAGVFRGS